MHRGELGAIRHIRVAGGAHTGDMGEEPNLTTELRSQLSRRSVLQGMGVGALGIAGAALLGCGGGGGESSGGGGATASGKEGGAFQSNEIIFIG